MFEVLAWVDSMFVDVQCKGTFLWVPSQSVEVRLMDIDLGIGLEGGSPNLVILTKIRYLEIYKFIWSYS